MVDIRGKFPKHFLLIKDNLYQLGDNFSMDEDLDVIFNTLNFTLPFFENEFWSTKDLAKYDTVKLYFKFYNTAEEREASVMSVTNPDVSDLTRIFDGYIDRIELGQDKGGGFSYTLNCKSTIGLSFERTTQVKFFSADMTTLINKMLEETDLAQFVDNVFVNGIGTGLTFDIDSTFFMGEVLENIKDKYALHVYQNRNSDLYITPPSYFNSQTVDAYEYDVTENVFNIDYGDLTQAIDTIIVVGTNAVGVAYDPIGFQLKNGVKVEDIDTSVAPDTSKLNIRYIYRRDLFDIESCQRLAKEKLIELAKNYTISFDSIFIPNQKQGETFIMKNSPKIVDTQLWIIKKITTTIEKNNIKSSIVGYSNSITDFPEDILLSSSGILDTDILGTTEKIESTLDLRG